MIFDAVALFCLTSNEFFVLDPGPLDTASGNTFGKGSREPFARITARSITFLSSRTLPERSRPTWS